MAFKHKFDRSRRVYTRLLYLYPLEHREEYGASMLQVFTDQLHAASREEGGSGFFILWVRTLWDLGISAIKEQFSTPHLTDGLLEAIPNQPLPWKGVALVLVPGLAFFIAQLGQLSGQDWFYWMIYRAGYILILPVLITWAWKRKFPLWGLIPMGLFFRTLWDLGYRIYNGGLLLTHPKLFSWLKWVTPSADIFRVAVIVMVTAVIIALLIVFAHRQKLPQKTWYWLGAYIVLCAAYVGGAFFDAGLFGWQPLFTIAPSFLYENIGFLMLILLGNFFDRRHGRLAVLLLIGYLLPTVIYGRFNAPWNSPPNDLVNIYLVLITIIVLVYRFIIALAAPVWVVRSATPGAQRKASLITLLICIVIQVVMHIYVRIFMALNIQYADFTWISWFVTFAEELVMVSGIGLATVLYDNPPPITQSESVSVDTLVRQ
jgi:hypothetical protein